MSVRYGYKPPVETQAPESGMSEALRNTLRMGEMLKLTGELDVLNTGKAMATG